MILEIEKRSTTLIPTTLTELDMKEEADFDHLSQNAWLDAGAPGNSVMSILEENDGLL